MCCTVNVVSAPPTPLGVGGDDPRARRIFDLIYQSCFSCLEKVSSSLRVNTHHRSLSVYCCLKLNQEVRMHLLGLPPFTVSNLPYHWTSKTVSWNHDTCPLKNEMPPEILSQRNESSNRNFTVRSNRTELWVGIFPVLRCPSGHLTSKTGPSSHDSYVPCEMKCKKRWTP